MEKILCAAIHYFNEHPQIAINTEVNQGLILSGWRHNNIIALYYRLFKKGTGPSNSIQGFLTSTGRFVDRFEAWQIANKANQLSQKYDWGEDMQLYSEDLY